ncbi:GAF and ANTAR domain-containing protein [Streptomyces sp. NBC_01373]|uniref:GAF and ANTAR domain-containing protein n=1 Tax=Streptomyces sp. NBC_01373 TaxID=2903843 RepID=UPI0022574442|nr:GAF and ANTAR domain-containing protein [Streptomyces sp. NBC_01373]MCX4703664.1 GAF and ANTAR domain-containing protein [Streptomyces sp. NBC_01373]
MRSADDDGDEPPEHVDPSVLEDRRAVADTFTSAAAAADVRQVPALLCQACVELLPITGASISITDGTTVRALWCASDRTASRLAEAQYTLGDGPCQTALARTAPVLAADLTRGPDARRWPVFAHQATELGVQAVFSLPLGTSALAIGTLDLYRASPGALSDRDLRSALLARDAVTFAVLTLDSGTGDYAPADGAGVASWVEAAEADHTEVHQAVGMVMVQLAVDPQQALDRLRARAFAQGRTVTEVAEDVLARALCFRPEAEGERPERPGRFGSDEGDGDRS